MIVMLLAGALALAPHSNQVLSEPLQATVPAEQSVVNISSDEGVRIVSGSDAPVMVLTLNLTASHKRGRNIKSLIPQRHGPDSSGVWWKAPGKPEPRSDYP